MPDVREVFEMATKTARPDPGVEERQQRKQRTHAIRQRAATYTVVASVLIAATVFGVVTLGGDERTKPAAEVQLTRENLAGVWRTRGVDAASASTLIFTADGEFEVRHPVRPSPPAVSGTYAISGDTITLTDPNRCQGMQWTARLPQQGLLEFTVSDAGRRVGPDAHSTSCMGALGSGVKESDAFAFERISPRAPGTADLDTAGRAEDGAPPSVLGDVTGVWLLDGGDTVLWIELYDVDDIASYLIWRGGGVDHDSGSVRLEGGSLVFSSNTVSPARLGLFGSPRCPEVVKRTVWENVLISGDAFAADVPPGTCNDVAPGRASWLRISGPGSGDVMTDEEALARFREDHCEPGHESSFCENVQSIDIQGSTAYIHTDLHEGAEISADLCSGVVIALLDGGVRQAYVLAADGNGLGGCA